MELKANRQFHNFIQTAAIFMSTASGAPTDLLLLCRNLFTFTLLFFFFSRQLNLSCDGSRYEFACAPVCVIERNVRKYMRIILIGAYT